ncbi:MAG: hypothetical protein MNPFHGCM_02164 [Gemmatimonadaceae bacterium]|nr:hypothetical protein [Gemmatimonadaceae bacterium]
MTTHSSGRLPLARSCLVVLLTAAAASGCRDNMPAEQPLARVSGSAVESHLIISTATPRVGDDVVVLVRVDAGPEVQPIASFTARLHYDPLRLRFVREQDPGDGAVRVLNPQDGQVRMAGIAQRGFAGGKLVAVRFTALANNVSEGLAVTFDELHAIDREDLRRVTPGASLIGGAW